MNDLAQYLEARPRMQEGDVIAFSGAAGVSPLIELATGSAISHLAAIRQGPHGFTDVKIVEATIEGKRNGVQTNPLGDRLANYDRRGRAWWLQLSPEVRKAMNWFKFYEYIGASQDKIGYDIPALFHFLLRTLPIIGPRIFQKENAKALECSGFMVELFEKSGILRGVNNTKTSPQDFIEMQLFAGPPVQILGPPGRIARFNTI